jgi:hypothetical protein
MESNQLAIISSTQERNLTPAVWNMIKEMAPVMHQSRMFGVSSVEQAAATMIKGFEVGFGFAASFDLIQVVQGRPGVSPRGCMALILNSPHIKSIDVKQLTDSKGNYVGHECTMERVGGFKYTVRFTMEDAKRAGLIKPDSGWEKYPENMCQWRAIGFCADVVAPDVTAGLTGLMKMPENFGVALTAGEDVIDVTPMAPSQHTEPTPVTVTPQLSLNDLLNLYTPEQIMDANDGKIPGTQEEINGVVAKLGGK